MKRLSLAIFFLTALFARAQNAPTAMGPGEVLRYKVKYGLLTAGEIVVSARSDEVAGLPQIRIATHTKTRGFVRGIYEYDGDGECVFDARDGRLLAINTSTTTPKKSTKTSAFFDYADKTVQYTDYFRPERNVEIPIPPGNPMDLITCLIETRRWDMNPGDRSPATVMFDKDFYELVIVAEGYEDVSTPMGKFKTLVLVPTMEKDPKGMFKRGGRVRVWIAQDGSRLPVKFEVAMNFGTGTAYLAEHQPPASGASVANADPRP